MRFFIFPLENINIAVAADKIKNFISSDIIKNTNDDKIKIPVCMIFGKQNLNDNSCHGIVLKRETGGSNEFVIVTPPVERDIYIEENDIQSFPRNFCGVYCLFSGLYFNKQEIILFLDIEKFISYWRGAQ